MAGMLSGKKMGIPIWGWGVGVAGAIGVGLYFRSKSAASTAATTAATPATDTTGTTTDPSGLGGTGVDLSGLATSADIAGLQQTLSDLPAALALDLPPPYDPTAGYTPWGPGADNPGLAVQPLPAGTVLKKNPAAALAKILNPKPKTKTGKAKTVGKTAVNKSKHRLPAKKPPKVTPKIVVHKATRPKPKKGRTAVQHNTATAKHIAGITSASQATHRAATPTPFQLTK